MGDHVDENGKFQSDKFPWCKPGFVPLKLTDPMAQPVLWTYAGIRASVDQGFADDLRACLFAEGYRPPTPPSGRVTAEELAEVEQRLWEIRSSALPKPMRDSARARLVELAPKFAAEVTALRDDLTQARGFIAAHRRDFDAIRAAIPGYDAQGQHAADGGGVRETMDRDLFSILHAAGVPVHFGRTQLLVKGPGKTFFDSGFVENWPTVTALSQLLDWARRHVPGTWDIALPAPQFAALLAHGWDGAVIDGVVVRAALLCDVCAEPKAPAVVHDHNVLGEHGAAYCEAHRDEADVRAVPVGV